MPDSLSKGKLWILVLSKLKHVHLKTENDISNLSTAGPGRWGLLMPGGVSERLNEPASKAGRRASASWVQIPPPPPIDILPYAEGCPSG